MDERFRKLQREYLRSSDPAVFQQLLLEASRSNVFSQWYLRYLSLLNIEPGPQLVPLGRQPARYISTEGKLRLNLFNRFWWGQTPEVTDAHPGPFGQCYFNAYRRIIRVMKRISEVGVQFIEGELKDSHPNRWLLLLPVQPSFPRIRQVIGLLESWGPENPPTMHQIAVEVVWTLQEFNRFYDLVNNVHGYGFELPPNDHAVLTVLVAILHQLYHTLCIFAKEARCVLCEAELNWQDFRTYGPDNMRDFWTEISSNERVLRSINWDALLMTPTPGPYRAGDTLRYLRKIQRQTHEFVIEEMFRQVELEILACDAATLSPMVFWN